MNGISYIDINLSPTIDCAWLGHFIRVDKVFFFVDGICKAKRYIQSTICFQIIFCLSFLNIDEV